LGDSVRMDHKVIFALFLVHFSGDLFSSFIKPLLPSLAARHGLSLAQVGLVSGLAWMLAFVVQPTVGYLADRHRNRLFVLGGPLLAMTCIPLVGVVPSFGLVLLCVGLGSVGSSLYHPTAAGMVLSYAGRAKGLAMAIFQLGGTLAFGVGPLLATGLVAWGGLEALPYATLLGLAMFVVCWVLIPVPESEGLKEKGFLGSIREALGGVWRSLLLIWVIIVVRSFVSQSFTTFIPMLLAHRGDSLMSIGGVVSLYVTAGALSGLLAGHLSDRLGYRPMFYLSYSLSTPVLFLLVHVPGNWILPAAFLAGFVTLATMPLAMSLAQELAPKGRSMVSSIMMGLAFGTGGMLAPLTGKLAESFGLVPVLSAVACIPLAALVLIRRLPQVER